MASSWALVTLGSPDPCTMTRFDAEPLRTRVVNRLAGPIRVRAFDAVTSLVVEAGSLPVVPLLLQTVALDAASTTAPLNDVPNRVVVAREVRADAIRVSAGVAAYAATEAAVAVVLAVGTAPVSGVPAAPEAVGAAASRRAPAATATSAERAERVVSGIR